MASATPPSKRRRILTEKQHNYNLVRVKRPNLSIRAAAREAGIDKKDALLYEKREDILADREEVRRRHEAALRRHGLDEDKVAKKLAEMLEAQTTRHMTKKEYEVDPSQARSYISEEKIVEVESPDNFTQMKATELAAHIFGMTPEARRATAQAAAVQVNIQNNSVKATANNVDVIESSSTSVTVSVSGTAIWAQIKQLPPELHVRAYDAVKRQIQAGVTPSLEAFQTELALPPPLPENVIEGEFVEAG